MMTEQPQVESETKKTKTKGVKKPKRAGRPHKRLEEEVLHKRIADMEGKIKLLSSRVVLYEDRLNSLTAERTIRENGEE